MCFVVVFSIRLYLIIDDYTYITLLVFLSFSHFISSLISIHIIIQSIQKIPPTPSCGLFLICEPRACSPAPGRGRSERR